MLKLLFGFDGSPASRIAAGRLAAMSEWWKVDEMCVVNVQPAPLALDEQFDFEVHQNAEALARGVGTRIVDEAVALFRERLPSVSGNVSLGDVATSIVAEAEAQQSTLIVLGFRAAHSITPFAIGSVVSKVLHGAPCGVLIVPAAVGPYSFAFDAPRGPVRVLLPVDGSPGALAAVNEVVRLAPSFFAPPEIHLLTVYDRTTLEVGVAAMATEKAVADYELEVFEAALQPARDALAGARLDITEHTAIGSPVSRIKHIIEKTRCDIVCVGKRAHTSLHEAVAGSTSSKLLHVSPVPVIVVPCREQLDARSMVDERRDETALPSALGSALVGLMSPHGAAS